MQARGRRGMIAIAALPSGSSQVFPTIFRMLERLTSNEFPSRKEPRASFRRTPHSSPLGESSAYRTRGRSKADQCPHSQSLPCSRPASERPCRMAVCWGWYLAMQCRKRALGFADTIPYGHQQPNITLTTLLRRSVHCLRCGECEDQSSRAVDHLGCTSFAWRETGSSKPRRNRHGNQLQLFGTP